jgi:hypothetical protein
MFESLNLFPTSNPQDWGFGEWVIILGTSYVVIHLINDTQKLKKKVTGRVNKVGARRKKRKELKTKYKLAPRF